MFAQINHMAMISNQYPILEKYYQVLFGFRLSDRKEPPESASVVGDGYVGLNIIPRRDGYVGGLDHFGVVVDDIDLVRGKRPIFLHGPVLRRLSWPAPEPRLSSGRLSR